jgi:hypothetical protein
LTLAGRLKTGWSIDVRFGAHFEINSNIAQGASLGHRGCRFQGDCARFGIGQAGASRIDAYF